MLKICKCCKKEKLVTDFHAGSGYVGGRKPVCKECVKQYHIDRHVRTYVRKTDADWAESKQLTQERKQKKEEASRLDRLERKAERDRQWVLSADDRLQKKKEQNAAYRKSYKEKHPMRRRVEKLNRKSKVRTSGKLSKGIVASLMCSQKGLCVYCKIDITQIHHVDHIYPISKGGSNTDENIQLLCPKCNLWKSDKDPVEFAALFSNAS